MDTVEKIRNAFNKDINSVKDTKSLEDIKQKYTGRKGYISELTKTFVSMPLEQKQVLGESINKLKKEITGQIESKSLALNQKNPDNQKNKTEYIDITLPPFPAESGKLHPLTKILTEILDIFESLGFDIASGNEIETDYYNFESLNIPKFHPARDMQDTFYINQTEKTDILLRTHTSPGQIHIMKKYKPPVRIVIPGKVYRHDAVDVTHSFMFHQVEGLAVNTDITFADLKGTLNVFAKRIFYDTIKTQFRPSYFPFTEPSAEMYIECIFCKGSGCKVCKNSGWLEVLGCGMVNPKVFDNVEYERNKYTGFAFGIGIERIAMLKYGIDDMRLFYENDLRFLKQF